MKEVGWKVGGGVCVCVCLGGGGVKKGWGRSRCGLLMAKRVTRKACTCHFSVTQLA